LAGDYTETGMQLKKKFDSSTVVSSNMLYFVIKTVPVGLTKDLQLILDSRLDATSGTLMHLNGL